MATLVFVEWIDSTEYHTGWTPLDEAEDADLLSIATVGFLLHEDDQKLVLSHTVGPLDEPEQCMSLLSIPKGCITRRIDFNSKDLK